ncbi:MAG: hypothetical protein M3O46_11045 [Myxococcota bacterium]|nr:hypothetical protein [Myxococcota bacterium]
MSSQSNGPKPDSHQTVPPSGPGRRPGGRTGSAWGAARDALAAAHNLEALLRSASVAYPTILDLLPELRASARVLQEAFEGTRGGGAAAFAASNYGTARVGELEQLLDTTAAAEPDRDALANRAHALANDLEASADLLALLERASDLVPTEVSLDLIVRETGRMFATGRGRELFVRFDEAAPDCVVNTDPYVVGPLLSLAIAHVTGGGLGEIVVRARCSPPNATLLVEAATPADSALPGITMRVLPAVPPVELVARWVADQIGALIVIEEARWAIALGSASS